MRTRGDVARSRDLERHVALAPRAGPAELGVVQQRVEVLDAQLLPGGCRRVGVALQRDRALLRTGGQRDRVLAFREGRQRGLRMLHVVRDIEAVQTGALARELELQPVVVAAEDGQGEVDLLLAAGLDVGEFLPIQALVVAERHRHPPPLPTTALKANVPDT